MMTSWRSWMGCVHSETCCPLGNCIPPPHPSSPPPRHGRLDRRTLHFSPGLAMPRSTGPAGQFLSWVGQKSSFKNNMHQHSSPHCSAEEPELQKLNNLYRHNFGQRKLVQIIRAKSSDKNNNFAHM